MQSHEESERTHQGTEMISFRSAAKILVYGDVAGHHSAASILRAEGAVGKENDGISESDHESETVFLSELVSLIQEYFEECIMGRDSEDDSWVG